MCEGSELHIGLLSLRVLYREGEPPERQASKPKGTCVWERWRTIETQTPLLKGTRKLSRAPRHSTEAIIWGTWVRSTCWSWRSLLERQEATGTPHRDIDTGGSHFEELVLPWGHWCWQVPFQSPPSRLNRPSPPLEGTVPGSLRSSSHSCGAPALPTSRQELALDSHRSHSQLLQNQIPHIGRSGPAPWTTETQSQLMQDMGPSNSRLAPAPEPWRPHSQLCQDLIPPSSRPAPAVRYLRPQSELLQYPQTCSQYLHIWVNDFLFQTYRFTFVRKDLHQSAQLGYWIGQLVALIGGVCYRGL